MAMLLCSITASAHDFEVDGIYYNITSATDLTVEVTYRGSRVQEYRDEYIGEVAIPSTVSYGGNTYSVTSIAAAFSMCSNLTSITIPASVTNIGGSAFKYCYSLTSVTIPDGVTNIGPEAFLECTSLTSIILPESVTSIGWAAFLSTAWYDNQPNGMVYAGKVLYTYKGTMPGNTSVEVKDGTKGIASQAFYGCNSNLTSITIPEGVTNIGEWAFSGCEGLTSIILPASVSCIGREAFYNTGLTSINIPASVISIGTGAFQGCGSLTSVTISEGVTSIGDQAFYFCSSLTSITIPTSVKSIGNEAFAHSGLTSITFPENVTSIGKDAFYSTIWDDQQPDGVTYLGNWLIDYKGTMPANTSIEIKEGTKGIADNAFEYCTTLTSITIPESVTNVGEEAFCYCRYLTSVHISSLEAWCNIDFSSDSYSNPLSYAENLYLNGELVKELVIPNTLTKIKDYVFSGYGGLTSVTCEAATPIKIGANTFSDISIPIYVPSTSVKAYQEADYWSEFINILILPFGTCGDDLTWKLTPDREQVIEGSGAMYDYSASTIPWSDYASSITTVSLPASMTSIGDFAFYDCSNLTSITIPESVTSIGECAFMGCENLMSVNINSIEAWCNIDFSDNPLYPGSGVLYLNDEFVTDLVIPNTVTAIKADAFYGYDHLTSVIIPESVKSIGECAFMDCENLYSVDIANGVMTIGSSSFEDCSNLTSVKLPEDITRIEDCTFENCFNLASISIPKHVELIGARAFGYCGITSIVIPEDVTSIGAEAFRGCFYLTSITIPKGVTSIGGEAFTDCVNLASITSEADIPPTIGYSSPFEGVEKSIPVYVPASSISAYQTADYWCEFTNIQAMAGDILATSLTLDVTEASLAPSEILTLTATLLPEDATNPMLTWTSSNEKVATVDEYGVVTAVADGEATITVSTTDGSNLSATCIVTVETKEAEGDVTDYDNMIYFEDATVFVNTTVTLPLQMKNSASITAVQFDVYLPEGVTIEKTSRGKYNVTFNEDRADNTTHTLSSALQDDGAIRVLCYSTESYDFLGGEGAIFYFPLEIPEMEDGDYDVVIRNIVLTDVSGTKYEIPSMTSTMTVLNVAPGDCNADNTIDVADIVVLANHILGTTADGFVEKAADYNADGAVDVADIVNIANYILNGNHAGARALVREVVSTRAAAAGYSLDILPFVLEAEGSKTIALELTDPTASFTAFQCDLYLPEGISIETNNRGKYKFSFNEERTEAAYHTLSGSLQADGAVRMLCYSTDSEVFLGTEGALIYIPLTADASLAEGVYEFSVTGTVLTYQSGVKVTPDTYKGSIVVGDGGEVQEVKLYGRYTSEVLGEYSTVLAANSGITSVDLTEAIYLPEDGLLTTGNPNTIVYLAEGDALSNEVNVVTGDECAGLVLTDGYAFAAPVAFSASQASYGRELAEGKYGTIVLPYAPDTDDYVFYALTSAGDDVLVFDEVETPAANTPYLYKLRDGKSATRITGNEVAVSSELTPGGTAAWQMVGSYANRTIAAGEDGDRYYYAYTSSDNKIHRVTNTLTVKPYRAYFTTASTVGTQLAIRTRGGEETLIDVTEVDGLCPEVYYDLSGRRVDNPVEGVYIVNGKKVVF